MEKLLLCRIDTIGIDFFPLTLVAITLEQYSFDLGSFSDVMVLIPNFEY